MNTVAQPNTPVASPVSGNWLSRHRKKLAILGLTVACVGGLYYWWRAPETWKWKEEAALADGRKILVAREVIFGGARLPWETGRLQSEWVLRFASPDDPRKTYVYRSIGGLLPGAIAFNNGVPYVLGIAFRGDALMYYDCPTPPYIVHRDDGGKWKRAALNDIPPSTTRMNLSLSSSEALASAQAGNAASAGQIQQWNEDLAQNRRQRHWNDIVRPSDGSIRFDCRAIGETQMDEQWKSLFRQQKSFPKNTE